MSVYSGTLQALRFQTVEGCRAVWYAPVKSLLHSQRHLPCLIRIRNQLPSQGRVTARNSWRANTKRRPKLGIDPQADRQLGHESQEDPDEDARRNSEIIMRSKLGKLIPPALRPLSKKRSLSRSFRPSLGPRNRLGEFNAPHAPYVDDVEQGMGCIQTVFPS